MRSIISAAVAAERLGLGGADYRDEVLGDFALRAEVRVFDARVDLARVELVDDERSAVLLRERGYFEDFVARVDAAGGVVRVGEEEELDAALEGLFERREVYAGAFFLVLVVHEDGHELAAEELGHLAVSEVVRLDYRDLVAGHDVRAHREEERALRAGREDEVFRRVYLRAGEGGELRRDVLEDFLSAAVGRVGLRRCASTSPWLKSTGSPSSFGPRRSSAAFFCKLSCPGALSTPRVLNFSTMFKVNASCKVVVFSLLFLYQMCAGASNIYKL